MPGKGQKCSPETREKIRASLTGRVVPPEVRAKIGATQRGVSKTREYKPIPCQICGDDFTPFTGSAKYCKRCFPNGSAKDRLRYYGLTQAQYVAMLVRQDNKCSICRSDKKLVVDHDHKTGKVRGLLCFRCNVALAYIEDRELLRAATTYLDIASSQDNSGVGH